MMTQPDFNHSAPLHADTEERVLSLEISPAGRIHFISVPGKPDLAPSTTRRIVKAFERGTHHGLLHLGATELATWLPSSLAFGRELAHLFMTRVCSVPNLTNQWNSSEIVSPRTELEKLITSIPLMTGAEYLDVEKLDIIWSDLQAAAHAEIADENGDVQAWLQRKHPGWTLVGRVCFHLAENKNNAQAPFAFLATYSSGISQQSRVQHHPLGRSLQEYAGAGDRNALLGLLLPVNKAAEQSAWLRSLVDSGAIFHPMAWTPADAHQFLRHIPLLESCGIVVRIPDWWKPHQPPRPQVQINIGNRAAGLGLDAMLDFNISLVIDGEQLSPAEWEQLLAAGDGLVRIKGRWVELDREKLEGVLAHWKKVQRDAAGNGLSFLDGMRLLAGAALESNDSVAMSASTADWSSVVAGDWLREVLEGLSNPGARDEVHPGPELKAQLRPYQQVGVQWLWWLNRLGLGGCLADDMGLGKTVQVIALFLLAKQKADPSDPHLLVLPASLISNWQTEITRFAPSLRIFVAHPSALPAKALATLPVEQISGCDVVITSYGSLIRLPWLLETRWSTVVLDEAQAIKNPGARQTRAAKALKSQVRLALTGTPVENRPGDLWSLFDFICPGLLGSDKTFSRFVHQLEQDEHASTGCYAPLRKLVQPYILRRLKSDKRIIADLPDKTELKTWCTLSRLQASLYEQAVEALGRQIDTLDGIARRGAVLAFLMRFKQICNHPSQWLGDGVYAPDDSGKFARLHELIEAIAARQEKVLIFTQFQEMTGPLVEFLQEVFGRPGLVLHGATPVKTRKALVDQFQQEQGPPFFVLSLKAGGTGLNLTTASHVIHFDRWWNPAVENQATDRAYRIGQKKNVLVHKFICRGTIEEKIDALIEAKLGLSNDILAGGSEMLLTEMSNEALLKLVSLDIGSAIDEK